MRARARRAIMAIRPSALARAFASRGLLAASGQIYAQPCDCAIALLAARVMAMLAARAARRQAQPANDIEAAQAEAESGQGRRPQPQGQARARRALFQDPDGGDIDLAEFKGAPVLVNLWASWCAPCVKELPTLDALAEGASRRRRSWG